MNEGQENCESDEKERCESVCREFSICDQHAAQYPRLAFRFISFSFFTYQVFTLIEATLCTVHHNACCKEGVSPMTKHKISLLIIHSFF